MIIGGEETQQVKIWDSRARQPLYELSTGNNKVASLVWDDEHQTLYAQTNCRYMTRMGDHMNYRKAHFRSEIPQDMDVDDEDDDKGDEDEFDDDDDDDERAWPEKAYHQEHSFGHPLDSGEHRLCTFPLALSILFGFDILFFQINIVSKSMLISRYSPRMVTLGGARTIIGERRVDSDQQILFACIISQTQHHVVE